MASYGSTPPELRRDESSTTKVITEAKIITALTLGFGLVGIDRFLISTMFPTIADELGLGYDDIGIITGVLAFSWGTAALLLGNLSDHPRVGRKRVLVGSLLVFALLIGASGLATGLGGLIVVRIFLGFADGAFTPASIAATFEASPLERRGRNIGIQQMMGMLCGLGFSPLIVHALLGVLGWRWIFAIFVIPALMVALMTAQVIPDTPADALDETRSPVKDWQAVLSYLNIWIGIVDMLCWLTCLVTTSAFMPNYLLDHLHMTQGQMQTIMSSIGFGAALGTLLLPWLSDRFGRKPMMLISALGTCSMLIALKSLGAKTVPLYMCLFMVHFFNTSAITLTVGPLCAETVRPSLMSSASGVVIAVGELVGGGLAPILVGQFVHRFGIHHVFALPIATTCLGFFVSFLLKETKVSA